MLSSRLFRATMRGEGMRAMGNRWVSSGGLMSSGTKRGLRRVVIVGACVAGYAGYIYAWREGLFNFTKEKEKKQKLVVLGSGWASVALMRRVDPKLYDVSCVSPRNYFLMTPLLPSVSVGTVETRTVCEPVRPLLGNSVNFLEAECVDIDPKNKKIICQSAPTGAGAESQFSQRDAADNSHGSSSRRVQDGARTRPPFEVDYDILVVAVGAENQTFNTPGVEKHAHFLKELPDARRIRAAISDCFESAALPSQDEREKQRLLTFVVVGGGPTGVEFAAELSDMVHEDLKRSFPMLQKKDVSIKLVEAMEQILSMYDAKISEFTENHFTREKIDVLNNTFVKEVRQTEVVVQRKGSNETDTLPCGMVVWATGIKARPFVQTLRSKIGGRQTNPRAVLTDTYLRVIDSEDIFAMGDCSSIQMPRVSDNIYALVPESKTELSFEEFENILSKHKDRYPQLETYAAQVKGSFDKADTNKDGKLQIDELKLLLAEADKSLRPLPATAQVANQEGQYLAKVLNKMGKQDGSLEGIKEFQYRHFGSLAYVGGDKAVIDFSGTGLMKMMGLEPISGRGAFYLWRSFYLTEMVTLRTKILLAFDWLRSKLFGRDISRV
eukprot:Plantae.Rhodophyta-Purpureofilum_apyrenoidigerum.ctg14397.p1 GENE.Plantae.Rhodophyta-Purpureofilum_apyrenoidigerum.ctg14397~~Plantae.Rhodophyta-Purpureofilum_apyrenoidigerum.ctg14397.p1  ORF type:complete len:609 (+),score=118.15 Plantae.Rhodophyta-Purpureofilum_apyrenoidigerum.ctg14397:142-1968(+)